MKRPITGVERYGREITRRLNGARLIQPSTSALGYRGHLWEQLSLPQQVRHDEILWSPANTGPIFLENQVVSIHDLSPIDHPGWFNPGFAGWYRVLTPKVARRSRKILTDSAFSRSRLIERLGLEPSKVISIPPGVDQQKFKFAGTKRVREVREKHNLPPRYLLYIGSIQPRKNIRMLLRGWENVGGAYPETGLVLAGGSGGSFRDADLGEIPKKVFFLGYVEDADLPALISGAVAFVHPSLYEGAGMALLEAMACGCPVVASNIPAFTETAGDAALYFSPQDTAELSQALESILEDDSLRGALTSKGIELVKRFTWEETAARVWAALQDAG